MAEVASWKLDREVVVACWCWRCIGDGPRVTVGRGRAIDKVKGRDSRGSRQADLTSQTARTRNVVVRKKNSAVRPSDLRREARLRVRVCV
jgi:hypothetical protein